MVLLKLYPTVSEECKFTIDNLNCLISQQAQIGTSDLKSLSSYYRQYYAISLFLIMKKRLSDNEQSCGFKCGLSLELWNKISIQLQLKKPDHNPKDAYTLSDIYAAAEFILQGTTASNFEFREPAQPTTSSLTFKAEDMTIMFENLIKTLVLTLLQSLATAAQSN